MQKDGNSVLHCKGQGQIGSSCPPKDLHSVGLHKRKQRRQDRAKQAYRSMQDKFQREIR